MLKKIEKPGINKLIKNFQERDIQRNFLGNSRKHFISSVYLSKTTFGVYEIDILFTTVIFKVKSRRNPLRNSKNIRKKFVNIFGKM